MTQHTKSLLFSIFVHSLLLAGIFYAFHEATSFIGHKKERRVCIKLGCIESVASKKVQKEKKLVKKISQKKPHKKKVREREVKKKIVPKKVIPLHKVKKAPEPPKIEKVEKKYTKEVMKVEQAECPAQQKEIKETNLVQHAQEKSRQRESSQTKYINMHLAKIAQLLQENLYYPRRARKRGIEGKVIVKFTLTQDAKVINSKILSSSDAILSRGALKTLENLSGEFPKPDEQLTLTVPISYSLHR
jgi:protein TonB